MDVVTFVVSQGLFGLLDKGQEEDGEVDIAVDKRIPIAVVTFVVVSWGLFDLLDKEEQEDAEVGIAVDKIDSFVVAVNIDTVIVKDLLDIVDKKVDN